VQSLTPGDKRAYELAAKLREDLGDYAGLVEVYDRLIELDPKYAGGYRGRARAKAYLGDNTGADKDYEQAIKIAPDDIQNLITRAQTRMVKGNEAGALADCDAVVKMAPKNYATYYTRARVLYNFGKFRKARLDMMKAIKRATYEPDYLHLYLFLSQSRIGSFKERAPGQLKHYVANKEKDADAWFLKIVAYLTGELPEEKFLEAATDATPKKTAERRCEAFFYAGTMRLVHGDKETAKRHFKASIATEIRNFIEYESATIELARLR
ncbi:MAG: hypothetical protein OER88_14130, partial [Planctomycetota bacterium]|nr:hypothetical protein [Planctomycetota bacterium]